MSSEGTAESSEQARFAQEIEVAEVREAGLDAEELSLKCLCESAEIDLLLDTGTVSNLVPEDRREVIQEIKPERAALLGVGGALA